MAWQKTGMIRTTGALAKWGPLPSWPKEMQRQMAQAMAVPPDILSPTAKPTAEPEMAARVVEGQRQILTLLKASTVILP